LSPFSHPAFLLARHPSCLGWLSSFLPSFSLAPLGRLSFQPPFLLNWCPYWSQSSLPTFLNWHPLFPLELHGRPSYWPPPFPGWISCWRYFSQHGFQKFHVFHLCRMAL
jgi:hypothetical protein